MTQAERIIGKLGGTRPAARLLGLPTSTVQSWKTGGYVPARWQARILRAARAAGIPLEPADFFAEADVSAGDPGDETSKAEADAA